MGVSTVRQAGREDVFTTEVTVFHALHNSRDDPTIEAWKINNSRDDPTIEAWQTNNSRDDPTIEAWQTKAR